MLWLLGIDIEKFVMNVVMSCCQSNSYHGNGATVRAVANVIDACDSPVAVHRYGNEMEDGRGTTRHVHTQPNVTHLHTARDTWYHHFTDLHIWRHTVAHTAWHTMKCQIWHTAAVCCQSQSINQSSSQLVYLSVKCEHAFYSSTKTALIPFG